MGGWLGGAANAWAGVCLPSLCSSANHSAKPCRTPCALRASCSECTSTSSECMWCSNMKQCVDSNAYVASFPFGQCMEWYTMNTCPRKAPPLSPPHNRRLHVSAGEASLSLVVNHRLSAVITSVFLS